MSAVKAYRSMLSTVFAFSLPSLSEDPSLCSLHRSFAIERPRSPGGPPSWDLDKVLRHLMSSTCEPLESQGLHTLTKKVLFLVDLATAKRVSELQALSWVVPSSGDDLVLSYLPFFVAKTESPSNPLRRSFRPKALSDLAHGLEEGSLLCPVRALRIYLRRTKGLARRSSALFVSPRIPLRAISKNAMLFFLLDVIIGAGAADLVSESSVRAHSIRGVATSVAFLRNWSVSKVLEAATWRSNSVFASFYLKDVSYLFEGLWSLGNFMATG